jgi:hypothetical protein
MSSAIMTAGISSALDWVRSTTMMTLLALIEQKMIVAVRPSPSKHKRKTHFLAHRLVYGHSTI